MIDEKTPAGAYIRLLSTAVALRVLARGLESSSHPDKGEAIKRLVALADHCEAVGELNLVVHLAALAQTPAPATMELFDALRGKEGER